MNTTDYFTYVNAMFLFCIFTCGLLLAVGWRLTRKSEKLKEEQDAHLKATKINSLLAKENKEIDDKLARAEHKLRAAEKEIRELQAKLTEAESQANGYKAEFIAVSNELEATKAKVRKRDANGKFLPRDPKSTKYMMECKGIKTKVYDEIIRDNGLTDAETVTIAEAIKAQDKPPRRLTHGLTVKNPTKAEAKMIFDEAKRLRIKVSKNDLGVPCPNIWVYHKKICVCIEGVEDYEWATFVTAQEFVQRMQNGRG